MQNLFLVYVRKEFGLFSWVCSTIFWYAFFKQYTLHPLTDGGSAILHVWVHVWSMSGVSFIPLIWLSSLYQWHTVLIILVFKCLDIGKKNTHFSFFFEIGLAILWSYKFSNSIIVHWSQREISIRIVMNAQTVLELLMSVWLSLQLSWFI